MRELPLEAPDFATIRQLGDYYADKTQFLYHIARRPTTCFLSRPRRFGKTFLLSTLKYLLEGRRDLFKGLWIDKSDYNWTPYPVIKLEMNTVIANNAAVMEKRLSNLLLSLVRQEEKKEEKEKEAKAAKEKEEKEKKGEKEEKWEKEAKAAKEKEEKAAREKEKLNWITPGDILIWLISHLYENSGQKVAILIDEYDAPIVKHIINPPKAEEFREALNDFYAMLKTNIEKIGHIFITGVSRFTKTSIFSKLNNLKDITFNERYAAICGLTEADLDDLLSDREDQTLAAFIEKGVMLPGSDGADLRNLIRDWYDGYSWDGKTRVYNPWSHLSCLDDAEISDYWYDSGTPSFLVDLGLEGKVKFDWLKDIPNITKSKNVIDKIEKIPPEVLLFQTGYLTVKETLPKLGALKNYRLDFPNLEVRAALIPLSLSITPPENAHLASGLATRLRDSLFSLDAKGLEEAFSQYLAQFPYDDSLELESHFSTLLQSALMMAKQEFNTQEHSLHGRLDIHLTSPKGDEHIIELKVYREKKPETGSLGPPKNEEEKAKLLKAMAPSAQRALNQITTYYADKFTGGPNRVVLTALVIARRNVILAKFKVLEGKLT
ncbi:MAG: AAA family ATPase [Deltaproteobacteria bacterium]|jgi:hypothetical protein|nr:AAA family ATPase [Deltaproteobacteria bacterium]